MSIQELGNSSVATVPTLLDLVKRTRSPSVLRKLLALPTKASRRSNSTGPLFLMKFTLNLVVAKSSLNLLHPELV